jgi:putative NADPH-quinone reductase
MEELRKKLHESIRKDLEQLEEVCRIMREEIERAKRAGFDVSAEEADLLELERRRDMIKREYGALPPAKS